MPGLEKRVEVGERKGPGSAAQENQADENGTLKEVEDEFHKTGQVDHRRNTDKS